MWSDRGIVTIDTPPLLANSSQAVLTVNPNSLDLGLLAPGQASCGIISLRNDGGAPISVTQVQTSCECVAVDPSHFAVDPKSTAELVVRYDPTDSPDFRG